MHKQGSFWLALFSPFSPPLEADKPLPGTGLYPPLQSAQHGAWCNSQKPLAAKAETGCAPWPQEIALGRRQKFLSNCLARLTHCSPWRPLLWIQAPQMPPSSLLPNETQDCVRAGAAGATQRRLGRKRCTGDLTMTTVQ